MSTNLWPVLLFLFHWKTNAEDIKCNISKNGLSLRYTCHPRPNQEISLYIQAPEIIEIKCFGITNANDMILPEIDFGKHVAEFRTHNCPIPKKGFADILKTSFHVETLVQFSVNAKSSNESFRIEHFQGLDSMELLRLTKCNITHFDGKVFKLTPRLLFLQFSHNNLILYDGQFKEALSLTSLHLSYNNITYLPRKVFMGLKNLLRLNIKSNKIQIIEQEVFRDLINLEDLLLDVNLIQKLHANTFEYQRSLIYLDLEGNRLGYISHNLFINCTNLQKIYLRNNENLVLENEVFSELLYLNLVYLKNSRIQNLPEEPFKGSVNLYTIELQHNELKSLPKDIFKNLELLKELYLNNNRIEKLDSGVFESLKSLQILRLQHNLLSIVDKELLTNSDNLVKLDLSFNRIHTIPSDIFSKKADLIYFWINNNRLDLTDFLPQNMEDCENIKLLDFTNNKISLFPYALVDVLVRNAKYEVNMTSSENTGTSKGLVLSLKNNKISQIKFNRSDVNNSTNLLAYSIKIIVSENPINCDCKALDLVMESKKTEDSTKSIIFDYNNLFCDGPPNLANTSIREIDVNKLICSLEKACTSKYECDCNYKSVNETVIIDCSRRNLSDIPQLVLGDLSQRFDFVRVNKVELHMEDNLLKEGLTDNEVYHNVTGLYLQRNMIKYIAWVPPHIEILNLDLNQLESMDPEMLIMLNNSALKNLSLSSNPWRCDCTAKDFVNYLWTNILKINNASQIRCNTIEKGLIYLDEEDLCPFRLGFTSIICSAILICFIICSSGVLLFYIYEKEILIWLYARGTCLWLIKEERLDKNKKYDAFVSFAHQDEEFVMDRLLPILELGIPQYKFCVHVRDWIPGEYIATQISNSVRDSRRTLIILSQNFIRSVWGRMEFRTAHTSAMKEGRVRIILIIYGDVDMDQLDDELKAYIKTNTYIEWGDPWFWEKLRYALPRTRQRPRKKQASEQRNRMEYDVELH